MWGENRALSHDKRPKACQGLLRQHKDTCGWDRASKRAIPCSPRARIAPNIYACPRSRGIPAPVAKCAHDSATRVAMRLTQDYHGSNVRHMGAHVGQWALECGLFYHIPRGHAGRGRATKISLIHITCHGSIGIGPGAVHQIIQCKARRAWVYAEYRLS